MSNLANNLFNAMQQKAEQVNKQQKIEKLLKESEDKLHEALALIGYRDIDLRREALLSLHHNSEAISLINEVNE